MFENANANLFVGDLMFEDGFGNYTIDLIDDANGRFKLNGYNLLVNSGFSFFIHSKFSRPHENLLHIVMH